MGWPTVLLEMLQDEDAEKAERVTCAMLRMRNPQRPSPPRGTLG